MKTILTCLALVFFLMSCEDQWGNDAQMAYVVEIVDNGDGTCNYGFGDKPGGTKNRSISMSCGLYKLGDGIFADQK